MQLMPLTQGRFAMVDDADYTWLSQWKWCATKVRNLFYALRRDSSSDGTRSAVLMHRTILGITDPAIQVDHRSGNPLDNRRFNLRVATHAQNQQNAAKRKDNTSGVRGVSWSKHSAKWQATISVAGKNKHLGYFTNIKDAKAARLTAELEHHGQFSATLSRKKPAQSVTLPNKQTSAA